jgi:hypothetical protein
MPSFCATSGISEPPCIGPGGDRDDRQANHRREQQELPHSSARPNATDQDQASSTPLHNSRRITRQASRGDLAERQAANQRRDSFAPVRRRCRSAADEEQRHHLRQLGLEERSTLPVNVSPKQQQQPADALRTTCVSDTLK